MTVTDTSSASVDSGMAVAIIYINRRKHCCRKQYLRAYLVNQLTTVDIFRYENLSPKVRSAALDQITGLLLVHRIVVRDCDKLIVTESLGIGDVCKVRVAFLAVFANNQWFIEL